MAVLFRIVELSSGSVMIDGIDIAKIGLRQLRNKITIIPQEALLFSGTIRSNLDPFGLHEDKELWDALRRAHVIDLRGGAGEEKEGEEKRVSRFTLDTVIEAEGANLSVGERSLLSLARALCKDAHTVVMDEATARYVILFFPGSHLLILTMSHWVASILRPTPKSKRLSCGSSNIKLCSVSLIDFAPSSTISASW